MKNSVKFFIILGVLLIAILGASFHYFTNKKVDLLVIPHFMIDSWKVSEFYKLTKQNYYWTGDLPDRIILISPNHFFTGQRKIEGLCKKENIKYWNYTITALPSNIENIECSWWVFYSIWSQRFTKDHWLWEHFKWLNEYYSWVDVIPLALPTHQMNHSKQISQRIKTLAWKTLVISSVDFSHYKSEETALENDKISYSVLNSTWNFDKLINLDVDCPACLGVDYLLAEKNNLKIQQRYRDSSSTIVGHDLEEENTSRQFLFWEY